MSFLQPIQQALAGAGSAFNCSSQLATFDALQASSPQSTPAAVTSTAGPDAPAPTAAAGAAASAAANQAYGAIGQPDTAQPTSLSGILNQLLGGS
jgi:hypothetical protein